MRTNKRRNAKNIVLNNFKNLQTFKGDSPKILSNPHPARKSAIKLVYASENTLFRENPISLSVIMIIK
jgi:hypothetical protein